MSGLRRAQEWVLISVVLLLCIWFLRSFLVPLAWSAIIALASWPLYRRFVGHLPRQLGSNGRALLFTILVTVLVLGPFAFAFVAIGSQAQAWAHEIAAAESRGLAPPDWLITIPLAGSWMVDQWSAVLGTPGGVTAWLHRADSAWLFGWAGSLGQFVLRHAMIITFTVLGLFFIYRGDEPLAARITQLIHDKFGQRGDSYFRQATGTIRATVGGMVVVALVDGVLIGVAYAIAHVPSPQVWGAVTGLLAMIPFLAYFAVAAVALVLVAKGAGTAAIALVVWGTMVVLVADKVVRPALVGSTAKLSFFWTLVGGLGGLETLGLLGLFVGPVVLALAGALWRDCIDTLPNASDPVR